MAKGSRRGYTGMTVFQQRFLGRAFTKRKNVAIARRLRSSSTQAAKNCE